MKVCVFDGSAVCVDVSVDVVWTGVTFFRDIIVVSIWFVDEITFVAVPFGVTAACEDTVLAVIAMPDVELAVDDSVWICVVVLDPLLGV